MEILPKPRTACRQDIPLITERALFACSQYGSFAGFLTRVALNKMTDCPRSQPAESRKQTQAFGFALDLVKIYLVAMKNGFNLFYIYMRR
jgi:hypothetical protein